MEQYISKADIIEVIKRRRKDWCGNSVEAKYKREECDDILFVIDNIETKEVDFEKEIENWMEIGPHTSYPWCTIPDAIKITAEHFYELGVRASNPITAADRGIANEIIFALNALGEEKMISYDKEIEWVMNKVKEGE